MKDLVAFIVISLATTMLFVLLTVFLLSPTALIFYFCKNIYIAVSFNVLWVLIFVFGKRNNNKDAL